MTNWNIHCSSNRLKDIEQLKEAFNKTDKLFWKQQYNPKAYSAKHIKVHFYISKEPGMISNITPEISRLLTGKWDNTADGACKIDNITQQINNLEENLNLPKDFIKLYKL